MKELSTRIYVYVYKQQCVYIYILLSKLPILKTANYKIVGRPLASEEFKWVIQQEEGYATSHKQHF